jgi:hypothetical protein
MGCVVDQDIGWSMLRLGTGETGLQGVGIGKIEFEETGRTPFGNKLVGQGVSVGLVDIEKDDMRLLRPSGGLS